MTRSLDGYEAHQLKMALWRAQAANLPLQNINYSLRRWLIYFGMCQAATVEGMEKTSPGVVPSKEKLRQRAILTQFIDALDKLPCDFDFDDKRTENKIRRMQKKFPYNEEEELSDARA